jgi:hypothetical protein
MMKAANMTRPHWAISSETGENIWMDDGCKMRKKRMLHPLDPLLSSKSYHRISGKT